MIDYAEWLSGGVKGEKIETKGSEYNEAVAAI